jgi:uncharacterized protein involved in exopolysaccharide biosynthesis
MREKISVDMINADVVDPRSGSAKQATIAFTLSFEDTSPALAQKVTNDLVSLFLNENLVQREEAVKEASNFLRGEAEKLADHIRGLESAFAAFKEEHRDNLPEHQELNRELMARTEEKLRDNDLSLRNLEEQKVYLETELEKLDPNLSVVTSSGGQQQLSPEQRLQQLEAAYVQIKARYLPTHPDRIRVERELAAQRKDVANSDTEGLRQRLEGLNSELAAAKERYSPKHPDVKRIKGNIEVVEKQLAEAEKRSGEVGVDTGTKARNPAYVQLRARLESTKLEMKNLREAQDVLKGRLAVYEQRLIEGPNINRDYLNLTRDYDNALSKYREIKDKQMQAELAQALESERKGERFTLIEPPLVPEKPEKPNRPAIMLLGLVMSFASGAGNLALREFMDKGLRGAAAIQRITQVPPLAVIPFIPTQEDRRRSIRKKALFVVAVVVIVTSGVIAVHIFVNPLDLLWFSLLRRAEAYLPTASNLF